MIFFPSQLDPFSHFSLKTLEKYGSFLRSLPFSCLLLKMVVWVWFVFLTWAIKLVPLIDFECADCFVFVHCFYWLQDFPFLRLHTMKSHSPSSSYFSKSLLVWLDLYNLYGFYSKWQHWSALFLRFGLCYSNCSGVLWFPNLGWKVRYFAFGV